MLLPRSLYIKSSLTPMWCTLWHRLGTELCHCRPEGHRGVAESLHWIWGWAQTLTLPRDGIFARSRKHDHQAGCVASRVWGGGEQARLEAAWREGLWNNTIGGVSAVWTALTFTKKWERRCGGTIAVTDRCGDTEGFAIHLQWFYSFWFTHYFLVGADLPGSDLEVLPSDDKKQEERQHEELPVPHRHKEDLRRQSTGTAFKNVSEKQNI